jgi:hypothetical protein
MELSTVGGAGPYTGTMMAPEGKTAPEGTSTAPDGTARQRSISPKPHSPQRGNKGTSIEARAHGLGWWEYGLQQLTLAIVQIRRPNALAWAGLREL